MDTLHRKKQRLEEILRQLGCVAIAFSAGVDSTFLLKIAHDVLKNQAVAITAHSCSFPAREQKEARAFCRAEGIEQILVASEELSIAGFRQNPENRCYLCKHALFTKFLQAAAQRGIPYVAEGSNVDDIGDYRPGLMAVAELGIQSPLRDVGLTKAEIRQLSRELGLPTWDKPSFACLASRFVYGQPITEEKLSMVEQAEQMLLDLGFRQVRVRVHGDLARIELLPEELSKLLQDGAAPRLEKDLRALGFSYVCLDLGGYQTGSMNRTITKP